jgi:hypothetical protein
LGIFPWKLGGTFEVGSTVDGIHTTRVLGRCSLPHLFKNKYVIVRIFLYMWNKLRNKLQNKEIILKRKSAIWIKTNYYMLKNSWLFGHRLIIDILKLVIWMKTNYSYVKVGHLDED